MPLLQACLPPLATPHPQRALANLPAASAPLVCSAHHRLPAAASFAAAEAVVAADCLLCSVHSAAVALVLAESRLLCLALSAAVEALASLLAAAAALLAHLLQ